MSMQLKLTKRQLMLRQRGHIYASKHEGWYSVSDETFYPVSSVHLTLDPSTGRKFMASRMQGQLERSLS